MDYGLQDQYIGDNIFGLPESLFRLYQYDTPARATCHNKNCNLSAPSDENIQRLQPIRNTSVEERISQYENTSVCEGGSPRFKGNHSPYKMKKNKYKFCEEKESMSNKIGNIMKFNNETFVIIFIFILIIFVIIHFNNSLNEIKMEIMSLRK